MKNRPIPFERYHHSTHGFHTFEYYIRSPKQRGCPWWFILQHPTIETREETFDGKPRYVQYYRPEQAVLVRRAREVTVKDSNNLPVGTLTTMLDIGQDPRVQAAINRQIPNRELDEELIYFVIETLAAKEGNGIPREVEADEDGTDQLLRPTEPVPPSPPIYQTKSGIRFRPEEVSQLELLGLVDRTEIDCILGQTEMDNKHREKRNAKSI